MRHREGASGQGLVEFALVLPVFIVILVGLFDAGRAVLAYNTLNNAAREAGRVAIVDQTPAHIRQEAIGQAVSLHITTADVAITYRNEDDSGACASQTAPQIGCLAVVTVTYDYEPVIGALIGSITLEGRTVFPIEATCVQPPSPLCPKGS